MIRDRIIEEIENIQLRSGDDKSVAAAIYIRRITGIMPVTMTPHGLFKASYNHCIELAWIERTQGREAVIARYNQMVADFIDVWENPLLG